jgi:hypothetical protein
VVESQVAYEKADELCVKLNKEKIKFEKKPTWLKNQYSVPRPSSLPSKTELEEDSPFISASKFRSVRKRVMKVLLEPLGYDVSSSVAAKLSKNSILTIIEFQAASQTSNYTINLGLHYTSVESLGAIMPKRTDVLDYACDYIFNTRIGSILGGHDQWYDYTGSKEDAEKQLMFQLQVCIENLDRLAGIYPTAQALIDEFSPSKLIDEDYISTKVSGYQLSSRDLAFILADYCSKNSLGKQATSYIHSCRSHLGQVSPIFEQHLESWLNKINDKIKN